MVRVHLVILLLQVDQPVRMGQSFQRGLTARQDLVHLGLLVVLDRRAVLVVQ